MTPVRTTNRQSLIVNRISSIVNRRFLVAFIVTVPAALSAQPAAGTRKWVDSALILIDGGTAQGTAEALDPAIALIDRVLTIVPKDGMLLHYKGYALYRRSNLMQANAKPDEIKRVLEEAETALEESGKTLNWPETFALRGSVLGQMIAVNPGPINAMRYGPRADAASDRAVELGPNNPRVFLLRGIGNIFKPALFGGGADNAERDIKKAIDLFATDKPQPPMPSWGHAEAYAWLGQVHVKQEKFDAARAAYVKALEIEPENAWVKHVLLPALDRRKP
jgi:Flp pilus assembly protein TadD